jgi:hypothetical protein
MVFSFIGLKMEWKPAALVAWLGTQGHRKEALDRVLFGTEHTGKRMQKRAG